MEEDIEVTIIDPLMEIPTSDVARSTKTLSTIREYDSSTVSHVSNGVQKDTQNFRNVESCFTCFPFSQRKVNSFGSSNPPLDIDLLLRYYAWNSNMEKSINDVLKRANEKHFNYPIDPLVNQVCKDGDRGPLVELRALYKILESLEPSSSEDTLLSTFRVRDILTKIQSLIGRCSDKQLEKILSHDPSIRMCKHCGVISCSNSQNAVIESRQSLPRTSYFLNTQILSNNTVNSNSSKMNREVDKLKKKQATKRIQKSNNNQFTYRRYRDCKKDCNSSEVNLNCKREEKSRINAPQRMETMIAEREHDIKTKGCTVQNAINEVNLEKDKSRMWDDTKTFTVEIQSNISGSQMTNLPAFKEEKLEMTKTREITKNSGMMRERKINSNDEVLENTINGPAANFEKFFQSFNRENCEETPELNTVASQTRQNDQVGNGSQQSVSECNEKVLKDILYVKSKLQLDNSKAHIYAPLKTRQGIRNKQSHSLCTPNNVASIINAVTCLAHGRLKSVGAKKKEFVSQFDKRTRVQSRYSNNKHSFVLHASRDDNPQLDFGSRVCDELKYLNGIPNDKDEKMPLGCSRNYSEQWKYIELGKDNNESDSATCLMEDDSLENCAKACNSRVRFDRSDTTTFSSSSAENMIREWIKSSHSETGAREACDRSVTLKPFMDGSSVKHQTPETDEKCVYCSGTSIDRQCDVPTDSYKLWHATLSNNQTKNQSVPYVLDDLKFQNSEELINQGMNVTNSRKIENIGTKRFLSKQLFKPLKSIKSMKSMKFEEGVPNVQLSTLLGNLADDHLRNVTRRITYNESSFRTVISDDSRYDKVSSILFLYRKILEDSKEMNWESFQRFVEELHPSRRHIWRDICRNINEAAKMASKGDGITEVCIEIGTVPCKETKREESTCNNEIVFEMDMSLRDVEGFLNRKSASTEKGQLDTLKRANEVIEDESDDVCGIKVDVDQAD